MAGWPSNWISRTLESGDIPVTEDTKAIIKAWGKSTPLPPYTNNPIGIPASFHGKVRYMGTGYAMYPTMGSFYSTFKAFMQTFQGQGIMSALTSDKPYPVSWRTIHALGWPGSLTETDYPAYVLDLTTVAYRESVNATPAARRSTSGIVGKDVANNASIMAQTRSMVQAAQNVKDGAAAINLMIRRHARNG